MGPWAVGWAGAGLRFALPRGDFDIKTNKLIDWNSVICTGQAIDHLKLLTTATMTITFVAHDEKVLLLFWPSGRAVKATASNSPSPEGND